MSNPALKYEGMDEAGNLFGLKFRESSPDIVELYIEDDGNWHYKCSFHKFWLKDLEYVVSRFIDERVGR